MTQKPVERQSNNTSGIVEEKFNIGGCNLCVRTCGVKTGPPVLFLHGLQSHAGVWEKVAVELAERGYFVIMPDRRGHGLSEHAHSYHMFDYVSDLSMIVKKYLSGTFTLVGHCESCYLVAGLAGAYPDKIKHLVMIQYPVPARTKMDIVTKTDLVRTFLNKNNDNFEHSVFKNIEQAAERSRLGAPFPMPVDVALHVAERNVAMTEQGDYSWRWDPKILNYRILYSTNDLDIVSESINRVSCPVSFIHGKDSAIIDTDKERTLDYTSRLNSNAVQHMVPGGHYPHLEPGFKEVVNVIDQQ